MTPWQLFGRLLMKFHFFLKFFFWSCQDTSICIRKSWTPWNLRKWPQKCPVPPVWNTSTGMNEWTSQQDWFSGHNTKYDTRYDHSIFVYFLTVWVQRFHMALIRYAQYTQFTEPQNTYMIYREIITVKINE